jgi:hypothetical protein
MTSVATKFRGIVSLQLNPHHQLMPLPGPIDSWASAVASGCSGPSWPGR